MKKIDASDLKEVYYIVVYGRNWLHLHAMDMFLQCFKNAEFLSNNLVYPSDRELPPNYDKVIQKLSDDGMIKINKYGIEITLDGKMKITKGGYRREILLKKIRVLFAITAFIASAITIMRLLK